MSLLVVTPESLVSAAADLHSIRSALDTAHTTAAAGTTELMAAGADEVSAAVAALFAEYGQEFQALSVQAGAFHQQFVQALSAGAGSYLAAEALNASPLQTARGDLLAAINAPTEALLARPLIGNGAIGTAVSPAPASVATLIMGGTGNPVPNSTYLTNIYNTYISPLIAPETAIPTGLTTPEQGWPLTGLHSLTFDTSVAQGLQILKQAIAAQPSGTQTVVFGFSQSATIATNYLQGIANGSIHAPPPSDLRFVLAGDPNNPDGGLFERFAGFYIPGFNETFNGATPDLAYPTSIYTIQYDGYADFPRYPLNFLADANAIAGIYYDHLLSPIPGYESLTPQQIATAVVEPVSPGATGDTTYYIVPTQNLPLLRPLDLPQPLLNLIQPDLRVLIDMGYGDIGGANTEYANLPTPASLFHLVNPVTLGTDLARGAAQGVQADLVLAGVLPQADMPDTYPFVPSLDPGLSINLGQPSVTAVSAVTSGLGSLLRALNIPPFGSG
ncbi:PE-PPE domain-containing protein [Mycobacterium sp.]|uniref:PE-PPE domain-containing protein n=1 Tax=Mycobacterium sp. TaxID=1785 RepID=UPI003F99BFE4